MVGLVLMYLVYCNYYKIITRLIFDREERNPSTINSTRFYILSSEYEAAAVNL
jgi:hypothetical protein